MPAMRIKKAFALLFIYFFASGIVLSQNTVIVDSLKKEFQKAKTDEQKVYLLDLLSRSSMSLNLQKADEYGQQLITFAEETRDRGLMIKAYVSNGIRCGYFASQNEYLKRSIEYFNKALEIAKHEKMEKETGGVQLLLASAYLNVPEKDKSLQLCNEAFSLISTLSADSLLAEAHNTYGKVYLARNDKTLALRHFLNGLRIAEKINDHRLARSSYQYLSNFYVTIEDYDKAIDYYTKAFKELDIIDELNKGYEKVVDINTLGNLFSRKKNYNISIEYFERSIRMADSVKFPRLKIPGYVSLLNQYLRLDQPEKALAFLNSNSGETLRKFLSEFGLSSQLDQAYGVIYTGLDKYDSAEYYFNKAAPAFENNLNDNIKIYYYRQRAGLYRLTGELDKSIEYYQKVKSLGEKNGDLENIQAAAMHMDSIYEKKGDFRSANLYHTIYYQYKDSIDKLNKANELAQIAAQDEQQRELRMQQEKEEAKEKRNRIQYMGITIAIAVLFILLVMLGWFKVSAGTIRAIGFVAFLIFFEFIFLVFKKNIYGITHGEPMYDLGFMIALAALLVPLHHWLEHKVIHFLTSHHMLRLRSIFRNSSAEKHN